MNNIVTSAYWREDKSTVKEYIDRTFKFIRSLKANFPESSQMCFIVVNGSIEPIPDTEESFKETLFESIYDDDAWYTDEKGTRGSKMTNNSICDNGYYSEYLFKNGSESISISIKSGLHTSTSPEGIEYGGSIPNSVILEYSQSSTITKSQTKLITLIIEHWNPRYLRIASDLFLDRTYKKEYDLNIGWITYLRNYYGDLNLKEFGANQLLIQDGTLITLSENIPDMMDIRFVDQVIKVRDLLFRNKILNWS